MIPFRVTFEPGLSLYEQVVYAAKKAIVSGQMRPGDLFPSVRALSAALKINPNTAHKVIGQLVSQGVLEVRSGIGTVVAEKLSAPEADRSKLLHRELEQLAVEAKKLGLRFEEVKDALEEHWERLNRRDSDPDTRDLRSLKAVRQDGGAQSSESQRERRQRLRAVGPKRRG